MEYLDASLKKENNEQIFFNESGLTVYSTSKEKPLFSVHPNLEEIRILQRKFAADRNWDVHHQPRNLLLALVGEVGELAELFQWRGEVKEGIPDWTKEEKEHLSQELSDVLLYLVRLSDKCHIDLPAAVIKKIAMNAEKYPILNNTLENSWESVFPVPEIKNGAESALQLVPTKNTRIYEYITFQEALENLNRQSEKHLNEKYFLNKSDEKTKRIIDSFQKEIEQYVKQGFIEDIKVRGRKDKSFTAWLLLNNGEMRIDASFLEKVSKSDLKVTAVTLLRSQNEERGLRISLKENKVRLYEIINGSYKINFSWKVNKKVCSISVNINHDGTITYSNPSQDLAFKDLEKNENVEIKIGDVKNKSMTLKDIILLGNQQSQNQGHEVWNLHKA